MFLVQHKRKSRCKLSSAFRITLLFTDVNIGAVLHSLSVVPPRLPRLLHAAWAFPRLSRNAKGNNHLPRQSTVWPNIWTSADARRAQENADAERSGFFLMAIFRKNSRDLEVLSLASGGEQKRRNRESLEEEWGNGGIGERTYCFSFSDSPHLRFFLENPRLSRPPFLRFSSQQQERRFRLKCCQEETPVAEFLSTAGETESGWLVQAYQRR